MSLKVALQQNSPSLNYKIWAEKYKDNSTEQEENAENPK